jgi:hypothetical protein
LTVSDSGEHHCCEHYFYKVNPRFTSVEFGNRIIQSSLIIDENFLDTEDAAEKLFSNEEHPTPRDLLKDVRLSTAAHMSARFTYVSPAGRYRTDGSHVVDGGYFENSGATTALDILRQVNEIIQSDQKKFHDIAPQIIRISNNPTQQSVNNPRRWTVKKRD